MMLMRPDFQAARLASGFTPQSWLKLRPFRFVPGETLAGLALHLIGPLEQLRVARLNSLISQPFNGGKLLLQCLAMRIDSRTDVAPAIHVLIRMR
jgi:hypothetical protein